MNFLTDYFKHENGLTVTGLTKELNVFYVLDLFNKRNGNLVILTNTLYEANTYYDSLKTYTDDVYLFPMDDFLTSVAVAISPDLKIKRLETLDAIRKGKKSIVVTNLMGFLRFLPDKNNKANLEFKISKGDSIKRDNILELLEKYFTNNKITDLEIFYNGDNAKSETKKLCLNLLPKLQRRANTPKGRKEEKPVFYGKIDDFSDFSLKEIVKKPIRYLK